MPKLSPHRPIFKNTRRRGHVSVGAMIGPAAPFGVALGIAVETDTALAMTATPDTGLFIVGSVTDTLLDAVVYIILDGDYCYLTSPAQDRMIVVDVSNPTAPSVAGSYTSSTNLDLPRYIAKSGDYVFVCATSASALTSIDVSNPASPTLGQKFTDANLISPWGIAIQGDYAYVTTPHTTSGKSLFHVIDISNPTSMSLVGSTGVYPGAISTLGLPHGVLVDGNYAYVAANFADALTVIDISTPSAPSVVGTVTNATTLDSPNTVLKNGNICYVGVSSKITAVDVSNPASPSILDDVSASPQDDGMARIGDIIFASNTGNEVQAYNVANPSSLVYTGDTIISTPFLNGSAGVATDGTYIYVAANAADRLTVLIYYP